MRTILEIDVSTQLHMQYVSKIGSLNKNAMYTAQKATVVSIMNLIF